jgi:hypothetical protein
MLKRSSGIIWAQTLSDLLLLSSDFAWVIDQFAAMSYM